MDIFYDTSSTPPLTPQHPLILEDEVSMARNCLDISGPKAAAYWLPYLNNVYGWRREEAMLLRSEIIDGLTRELQDVTMEELCLT